MISVDSLGGSRILPVRFLDDLYFEIKREEEMDIIFFSYDDGRVSFDILHEFKYRLVKDLFKECKRKKLLERKKALLESRLQEIRKKAVHVRNMRRLGSD